jgi:hypothetical protein
MKAEEYYENHFAPSEITVVSKETVIELMEQYAQQRITESKEAKCKLTAIAFAMYIYENNDESEWTTWQEWWNKYAEFTNHQNQEDATKH